MAASGVLAAGADRYPLLPGSGAAGRGGAVRIRSSSPTSLRSAATWRRRRAPGSSRSPCWRRSRWRPAGSGSIATASTTYTEPFNLARQFASIDHISNGRAAWNIVTSWLATAARNFGGAGQVSHADRYARGEEFMAVVKALWDSWAEDAVVDDRASGQYATADRIRPINHRGDFYQVAGPLNMPRCPQGRPVLVQAGSSDTGRRFAARHADAVFTAHVEKATAQEFYADLKALAAAEGRNPEQVLILPGLSAMIASTEAEAQRLAREVNDLTDPEVGRKRLSNRFGGHDFSHLPLDRPLAPEDFPDPGTVEAARSRTEVILEFGAARQADLAAVARLPRRRARPFRRPPARRSRSPT